MDKIPHLFGVFILSTLIGCASLGGVKSGAEVQEYKIEKSGATEVKKELLQAVSVAVANRVDSLQSGKNSQKSNPKQSSQVNDLLLAQSASPQETSPTQIDSLREKLLSDGSVKINPAQAYLIDYLRPKENLDTLFLANLFSLQKKEASLLPFSIRSKKMTRFSLNLKIKRPEKLKK